MPPSEKQKSHMTRNWVMWLSFLDSPFYLVVASAFMSNSSVGRLCVTRPSCTLNSKPIEPYLTWASMPDVTSSRPICCTKKVRTVTALLFGIVTASPIHGVYYFITNRARVKGLCPLIVTISRFPARSESTDYPTCAALCPLRSGCPASRTGLTAGLGECHPSNRPA
jgi:hypothetical protein